jgi:hypothetical protein
MLDQADRDQIAQWASTLARPAFVNAVANRFPLPPWNFGTIPHRNPNSTKHVWTKAEILVILYEWEHGIFAEHSWAWANKPTGFGWLPWIRRVSHLLLHNLSIAIAVLTFVFNSAWRIGASPAGR